MWVDINGWRAGGVDIDRVMVSLETLRDAAGRLLPGVQERLVALTRRGLQVTVFCIQQDNDGAGLPDGVQVVTVTGGLDQLQKMLASSSTAVAIGHLMRDVETVSHVHLAIAVLGGGACRSLFHNCDVWCATILDAFDLIINTERLTRLLEM